MGIIQVLTYASVAVFVIVVLSRFIKLARLPIHMRWELYPVAHEKGRAKYGGSYLEELDWWTRPRETSKLGELKVMIPEILLLAGVWEKNRKHWFRSWPFHFGLYLLIGLIGLLLVGGVASAAGAVIAPGGGWLGSLIHSLTYVVGYAGMGLALLGALALLGRRALNPDYREYTKKADYFNLLFFVTALAVSLMAHITADPEFAGLRTFFVHLVTFDLSYGAAGITGAAWLPALEILLASLLIAYVPLTHMSHFFTKYFMYHDIRWADEPNLRGGRIEQKLSETLSYPVSWAASHIGADGKKTWADVATADVEEND